MIKSDEQTVTDWKDDLNSLLVFTGLFSAVVTGFTVESYSWLQTSQPDASVQVQLLAQISSQLASFSVAAGFVNSTIQPIPLIEINPPAGPSKLNVQINTLWFLSLGISLIASLLSIMVQQWLREYRVPGHLSVRERIRLRQYRYRGLHEWGVPQIISLLPVLLQIALIMFLVGLCRLLESLDETVAKTFIVWVGVSLAFYFAFTVLPIAIRRCPYKNPIAHAGSFTMKNVLLVLWMLCLIPALFILIIAAGLVLCLLRVLPIRTGLHIIALLQKAQRKLSDFNRKVFMKARDVQYAVSGSQYWTTRELVDLPKTKNLDCDALIWAPSAVSKQDLRSLDKCLEDLTPDQQLRCVITWASQALNVHTRFMDERGYGVPPFDQATIDKMDAAFIERFQDPLLRVLPDNFTNSTWELLSKAYAGPAVLLMLRHIARTKAGDPEFTTRYAQRVISIRNHQEVNQFSPYNRLSTPCLFEISTILNYNFSDIEVNQLFDYALQIQAKCEHIAHPASMFVPSLEVIIVSAATAMHAVSRRPSVLQTSIEIRDKCRAMLAGLSGIFSAEKGHIRYLGSRPVDWLGDGVMLAAVPASLSLCASLVSFTEEAMPASELAPLIHEMINTFEGEPAFVEGVPVLTHFRDSRQAVKPVPQPGETAHEHTTDPNSDSEDEARSSLDANVTATGDRAQEVETDATAPEAVRG
ncbi:hypothetical protein BDW22DRAFT_528657 [Trametopsis cervina]|nr:hypothetical protein BDW22DRAFT_528657 [Trametopsis cervina]